MTDFLIWLHSDTAWPDVWKLGLMIFVIVVIFRMAKSA